MQSVAVRCASASDDGSATGFVIADEICFEIADGIATLIFSWCVFGLSFTLANNLLFKSSLIIYYDVLRT